MKSRKIMYCNCESKYKRGIRKQQKLRLVFLLGIIQYGYEKHIKDEKRKYKLQYSNYVCFVLMNNCYFVIKKWRGKERDEITL